MTRSPRRLARLGVALGLACIGISGVHARAADDPYANQQWNMTQIHATSAQSVSTGAGVKIGVIDSGVNANQEDLAGRVAAAATCVGTSGSASQCDTGAGAGNDIDGHGTHVAGILSALTGNGKGVQGVAPGAQLVVARVFSRDQNGEPTATLNDVRAGIRWVLSQGAKVVNLSIGAEEQGSNLCQVFGNCSSPLKSAVEEIWQQGALPVIAAGNSALYSADGYRDLDAIVVGATTATDTVASYSSPIGTAKWGMVAPGGEKPANEQNPSEAEKRAMILSTYGGPGCSPPDATNCYAYLAGTSMAAPHVSAVAAMLFARGVNRQAVVDTLLSTTDPVDCGDNCAGRLNAAKALGVTTTSNDNIPGTGTKTTSTPSTSHSGRSGGGGNKATATTGSSTTAGSFGFDSGTNSSRVTRPTLLPPQNAIVVNNTSDDAVPVGVLLVGVGCLAGAALLLSYSLRKTLTTLP